MVSPPPPHIANDRVRRGEAGEVDDAWASGRTRPWSMLTIQCLSRRRIVPVVR